MKRAMGVKTPSMFCLQTGWGGRLFLLSSSFRSFSPQGPLSPDSTDHHHFCPGSGSSGSGAGTIIFGRRSRPTEPTLDGRTCHLRDFFLLFPFSLALAPNPTAPLLKSGVGGGGRGVPFCGQQQKKSGRCRSKTYYWNRRKSKEKVWKSKFRRILL